MLLEGSPILLHTVRKFAARRSGQRNRGGGARRGCGVGRRDAGSRRFRGRACGWWRAATAGSNRSRTRCARLDPDTDLVAVHDAVRPFIDLETIHKVSATKPPKPAPPSWACRARGHGEAGEPRHQPRAGARPTAAAREDWCWRRRPQVFRYELLIRRAFNRPRNDGFIGTDESSLVERLDVEVSVVLGSDRNIKITKPGDMDLARLLLPGTGRRRNPVLSEIRTGLGWDVHRWRRAGR